MGAGLSGVGYLLTQQHPLDPALPLINFDIAVVLAPFLLLGVGLGEPYIASCRSIILAMQQRIAAGVSEHGSSLTVLECRHLGEHPVPGLADHGAAGAAAAVRVLQHHAQGQPAALERGPCPAWQARWLQLSPSAQQESARLPEALHPAAGCMPAAAAGHQGMAASWQLRRQRTGLPSQQHAATGAEALCSANYLCSAWPF